MRYTIIYKCGHTGVIELFGKEHKRKRNIAWYEENCVCPECYVRDQVTKREIESQEYALPELVGSKKQVVWAGKIRSKFIAVCEEQGRKNANLYEHTHDSQENIETHKGLFNAFCNEFFGETNAKVWIDRRDAEDKFEKLFYDYIKKTSKKETQL